MTPRSALRPYQERVVDYLYERDAAMAVLDMGAGKTISALTAIRDLLDAGEIRHALIIAPKRVAELVWRQEAAAWAHTAGLRMEAAVGTPERRLGVLTMARLRDVTIIGVDNVQWLAEALAKLPADHPLFDLLVIDETSRLKSPTSKRAKALFKIAPRFKTIWGLTGTPRPNSVADLFMQAAIVSRGKLWGKSFYKWRQANFYATDYMRYNWSPFPGAEARLQAEFGKIAMTLDPADMPGLPDLNVVTSYVTLSSDVRAEYDRMQKTLLAEVQGEDILAASTAVATGKLAQIAQGFVYQEGGPALELHRLKLDWLEEIVDTLDGNPLLVAYEFIEDQERLAKAFPSMVFLADHKGKGAEAAVDSWNAGEIEILAIHPASAGHGLNLQHGGHHFAWYGLTWSAELYDQAIKRIHRPGQSRPVTVHLCLAADTVDEMKRSRVVDKLTAQAAFRAYLDRV